MSRSRSRFAGLAAAAAVAAALVLTTALPASAHDELLSSSPSPGESLANAPEVVTLTFSGELLVTGAAVIVVDADGRDWVVGEPEILGTTVTATLDDGMPEAGFEIRWRVVSSDGHPISGLVPFTIGAGEPLVREATESTADTATPQDQSAQENQSALRVVLIGIGGAAVAVGLLTLITFLRRRRARATGTGPVDAAASDAPEETERHSL